MNEFLRRISPGVAVAGVALGTVLLFDPALQGAEPATTSAPLDEAESSAPDPSESEADETSPDATTPDSTTTEGGASSGALGSCSGESIAGDSVETPWGPLQVRLELAANGAICSVQAVTYPTGDHHSARINAEAIPYLDQQATALGVEFDAVTGATYTSEAYRQSLQSALDQR